MINRHAMSRGLSQNIMHVVAVTAWKYTSGTALYHAFLESSLVRQLRKMKMAKKAKKSKKMIEKEREAT